jgi:hypothetical protein
MLKRTMFNYFSSGSSSGSSTTHANEGALNQPKKPRVEFSHSIIIADPGNRKPIEYYESEIRTN